MRKGSVSRVGMVMLVGVMVLSAGVVLMTDNAEAAPPTKSGSSGSSAQNWDENLTGTARFTVLSTFGNAAVRDNNTGLVWEQAPDATTRAWGEATSYCIGKIVGGTSGWRLPSVVELNSMRDPSLSAPYVPGSVFSGVQIAGYWSATTYTDPITFAWYVNFLNGGVFGSSKSDAFRSWCVRGPMNADTY